MVCFKVVSGTAWTKAWLLLDCPCISHPPSHIRLVHGDANAQAALKAKLLEWAEGAGHALDVTLGSEHIAESDSNR